MCGKAADGMGEAGAFGDPEQWRYEWEWPYTRGEWLDQVPTFGGYTQLPPVRQDDLVAGIGAAIDAAGAASPCGTRRWRSPRREPAPPDLIGALASRGLAGG
jgi:hypothetical protein